MKRVFNLLAAYLLLSQAALTLSAQGTTAKGTVKGSVKKANSGLKPRTTGPVVTLTPATIVQASPRRIGVNMSSSTYYDSGQFGKDFLYKNNPGFEGFVESQIVWCGSSSTTTSCTAGYQYDQAPADFWAGATFKFVVGASGITNCSGTIAHNTATNNSTPMTYTFSSACSQAPTTGDWMEIRQFGTSIQAWNFITYNGGSTSISTDVPSSSAGVQSLRVNCPKAGAGVAVQTYVDSTNTHNFRLFNGNYHIYFWAKLARGTNGTIQPSIGRNGGGTGVQAPASGSVSIAPTASWAQYSLPFTAAETATTPAGTIVLQLQTFSVDSAGADILIDDVSIVPDSGDTTNTTVYSDAVVTTLRALAPGTLRYWDYEHGESLDNWLLPYQGRKTSDFAQGGTYPPQHTQQGLFEFLMLCKLVGANPWISVPTSFSLTEAQNLMDFLGGGSATSYGAKRVALGQTTPFTSVFSNIYLELGNEPWNTAAGFMGQNMGYNPGDPGTYYTKYGVWANTFFNAMKGKASYTSGVELMGLGCQNATGTAYNCLLAHNASAFHDFIAMGPYIGGNLSNVGTLANEWQPEAASAWADVHDSSNGLTAYYTATMNGTSRPVPVESYEFNQGTIAASGNVSGSQLATHDAAAMNGPVQLSAAMERVAVYNQAQQFWSIAQETFNYNSTNIPLFGIVTDMGGQAASTLGSAYAPRPQFIATAIANKAMIGPMFSTTITNGPTYSPSAANGLPAESNVPSLFSYGFGDGGANRTVLLINTDPSNAVTITWGGTVPSGTATQVLMQNTNGADDTNETTPSNVAAVTSTVTLGSTYTIPAASVVSLAYSTSGGGTVASFPAPSASVSEGQSVSITAGGCGAGCTFSLNGVGSITSNGNTVTYIAPNSVTPQHKMLGCPVMPNDSIFNTRVDNLPLDSRSATWIAGSAGAGFSFLPSWGISYADASTPTRALKSYFGEATNTMPWPAGVDMRREGGNYIGQTGFSAPSHHVMTVKRDDCSFYDAYNDRLNGSTIICQDGATTGCNVATAISYKWSNYQVQAAGGTDAAGLPLAPLTVHLEELKAGVINHAMRYITGLAYIQGNAGTGTPLLWPASRSGGCASATCPSAPIIGARARLKAGFNIGGFSATAQVLLLAMQQYGIVLADVGAANTITTSSDMTSDAAALSALNEIQAAAITISNFEFVDESSLQVAANSYQTCPLNQTCAGAQNTYVAPLNSAVITAAPSSGVAANLPVSIQGVTVGSKLGPDVLVMAGNYTWTFPTWVNGSTNQTVNWTLTSGVGAVSSAGVYTPPASTSGGTSAVLHGIAAADSAAVTNLYLTIVPPGTIRIDTGATAGTTDTLGNSWLGGIQPEGLAVVKSDVSSNWVTTSPYKLQYETGASSYGNDLTYSSIIVPNGNYDVSYLIGLSSQCGSAPPCGSFPTNGQSSIYSYAPVDLESQGQIGAFAYDPFLPIGYLSAAPTPIVTIPAKVTNNVLYASIRGVANDTAPYYASSGLSKATILQGLTVAGDTASPHWSIYTQQQTSIAPGQTLLPFRVVDWFTGVNDPIWTVKGAGATITTTTDQLGSIVGTLSLAAGNYFGGQPIVVTASDGTYSASATIYTQGAPYIITALPKVGH